MKEAYSFFSSASIQRKTSLILDFSRQVPLSGAAMARRRAVVLSPPAAQCRPGRTGSFVPLMREELTGKLLRAQHLRLGQGFGTWRWQFQILGLH